MLLDILDMVNNVFLQLFDLTDSMILFNLYGNSISFLDISIGLIAIPIVLSFFKVSGYEMGYGGSIFASKTNKQMATSNAKITSTPRKMTPGHIETINGYRTWVIDK